MCLICCLNLSTWVNLLLNFLFLEFPFDFLLLFPILCPNPQFCFSSNVIRIVILKVCIWKFQYPEAQFLSSFVSLSSCCLCIWLFLHLQTTERICGLEWYYLPPGKMYNCLMPGGTSDLGTLNLILENDMIQSWSTAFLRAYLLLVNLCSYGVACQGPNWKWGMFIKCTLFVGHRL